MNQNIHLAQQKSSKNLVILDAFKTTHGVSLDLVYQNNVGYLYSFEIYKRKSISEEINTCCLSRQSKSPKCIWPNKKRPNNFVLPDEPKQRTYSIIPDEPIIWS